MRILVKCACGHVRIHNGPFRHLRCRGCDFNPDATMNRWIEQYEAKKAEQERSNATSNTR